MVIERKNKLTEKGEASRDGSILQKNSVRGPIQKSDATREKFVVGYKEYAKSISVSMDMWAKICTDTYKVSRDKHPLLKLILGGKTRLAVIEWGLFEEMEEAWLKQLNQ